MIETHTLWAAELGNMAMFVDERHRSRFVVMLGAKATMSADSIPHASGSPAATKAAYEFLSNPRVQSTIIEHAVTGSTANACCDESVVLVVHDTTTANFTGSTTIPELGPIDSGFLAKGVHIHTSLVLDTTGVVVGIGAQQIWVRPPESPGKKPPKEDEDKESYKWIQGIEQVNESLWDAAYRNGQTAPPRQIHLGDREADTCDTLQTIDDIGQSCVIRSVQNRTVDDPLHLAHDAVRGRAVIGEAELLVPRKGQSVERLATVEIRVLQTTLVSNPTKHPNAWSMQFTLVEVYESNPPVGTTGLHWLLWTREPADTLNQALRVVALYKFRWKIEDFHFAYKSGCRVEDLRLRDFQALAKALRMYAAVAARIVQMRDAARIEPEAPALGFLTADECEVLQLKYSQKHVDPFRVPLTIGQAVMWIGRLGGHQNRKGDGMPGARTLWRGLHDLKILVEGYRAGKALEKRRIANELTLEKETCKG